MKRIAALLFIAGCAVVTAETPCDQTCQNVAALNRDSVMLETAFEQYRPDSCDFSWTFPKGMHPIHSAGWKFKKNRDGTITAWQACGKRRK